VAVLQHWLTNYVRYRTDNRSTGAYPDTAMGSLSYISQKSRLLRLFKAAKMRLMATSENVSSLSDARVTSAFEEIDQISDDIRDAKGATSSNRADAATPASKPTDSQVDPLPTIVAVSAGPRTAKPKAPHKPPPVAKVIAVDLSVQNGDGVQWAGEYDALAGGGEKAAFVSQLVTLGYIPNEFRVIVRRVPSEGCADPRARYTVLVIQLRDGALYRERRYFGGQGADWVNDFSRDAATDFPRNVDPSVYKAAPPSAIRLST
jgi:hypothetical protein